MKLVSMCHGSNDRTLETAYTTQPTSRQPSFPRRGGPVGARTSVGHDDAEEHDAVRGATLVRRLDRTLYRAEYHVGHQDRKHDSADLVLPLRPTGGDQ